MKEKNISNRVLKMEMVEWKSLSWLQPKTLKEMSTEAFGKLKASIVNNNFADPFKVWRDGDKTWILDGHHRKRAMEELEKEGVGIPDVLPAVLVDCKNRKEAVRLVRSLNKPFYVKESLRKLNRSTVLTAEETDQDLLSVR